MCEVPNSMNRIDDPEPQKSASQVERLVIKLCPFCNSEPGITKDIETSSKFKFHIECCYLDFGNFYTYEETIKEWNKRAL